MSAKDAVAGDAASADTAAAQRVLASKHAKLLLSSPSDDLLADLAQEIRRRSVGRKRRLASVALKTALLLALINVATSLLFGHFPALWQLLQNTEAFSRTELEYNHIIRRLTVSLGLHNYELLHAREREQCLLPNPLYRPPLLCCPCQGHRIVASGSAGRIRSGFERLFDRMVVPFSYANNSQPELPFAELRATVAANWEAVVHGSNRLRVLWPPAAASEAASLERLFLISADKTATAAPPDAPPAGRAISWLFGHLSAIRVLRGLLRRPDHVPELAEDILARQFVFLGDGVPAGEPISLSDMGVVRGLAYAYVLHGEVSVSLALKPECCPTEVAKPSYRNETQRLGRGDILSFLTNCYWVSVAKLETSKHATVYFGALFNGMHPTEGKAAKRKPQ